MAVLEDDRRGWGMGDDKVRKHHADLVGMVLAGSVVVTIFTPTLLGILVCMLEYGLWYRIRRADWNGRAK